jgi:hypothetical protein
VLNAGVKIYDGFAGTETSLAQYSLAANKSILSGDNLYHTVICAGSMIRGSDTARLDDFVIRNGKAKGSGTITVNSHPISANSGGGIFSKMLRLKLAIPLFGAMPQEATTMFTAQAVLLHIEPSRRRQH